MSMRVGHQIGRFAYVNVLRARIRSASSVSEKPAPTPTTASSRSPVSSCPANTALTGLTWLKGQPPVVALEDSEYPAWLWTLLDEKKPGNGTSKPERRKQNREKIRLQNFMKSQ